MSEPTYSPSSRSTLGSINAPTALLIGWLLSIFGLTYPLAAQPSARVIDVYSAGLDVLVNLKTQFSTDVVVVSQRCGEVGRVLIDHDKPKAFCGTLMFSSALASVVNCGPQYWIEFENTQTPPPDTPFRVKLACGPQQVCSLELSKGVAADGAIPVSPELDQALDAAAGSSDLLTTLLQNNPSLSDEIYTYAFHLGQWLIQSEQSITETCSCHWTGVVSRTQTSDGIGSAAYPGQSMVSTLTSAELKMKSRCQKLERGPQFSLHSVDGQELVSLPAMSSCATGQATLAEYNFESGAWTSAEGELGHEAIARANLALYVEDVLTSSAVSIADRPANLPTPSVTDIVELAFSQPPMSSPQHVEARISTFAAVDPMATAKTFLFARPQAYFNLIGLGHPDLPTMPGGVILIQDDTDGEVDDTIDDGEWECF